MNKEIAEQAGLTYQGKNSENQNEFLGTDKQWEEAEKLENCENCNGSGIMNTQNGEDDFDRSTCVCRLD